MARTYLQLGGGVAAGFDTSGEFLLVISHSGRGVFSTKTWQLVARDPELAYPENNVATGIGPINGQVIPIVEIDYDTEKFTLFSPDRQILLRCESSGIEVATLNPPPPKSEA